MPNGNDPAAYRKFHMRTYRFLEALLPAIYLTVPALAEPTRDAVMDGAARCAGIPDNRVWLDCFYGSAPPMRAALGLSSAPESQTPLAPGAGTGSGGGPGARAARPPTRESESLPHAPVRAPTPLPAQ